MRGALATVMVLGCAACGARTTLDVWTMESEGTSSASTATTFTSNLGAGAFQVVESRCPAPSPFASMCPATEHFPTPSPGCYEITCFESGDGHVGSCTRCACGDDGAWECSPSPAPCTSLPGDPSSSTGCVP
jgi:hypothetical protein